MSLTKSPSKITTRCKWQFLIIPASTTFRIRSSTLPHANRPSKRLGWHHKTASFLRRCLLITSRRSRARNRCLAMGLDARLVRSMLLRSPMCVTLKTNMNIQASLRWHHMFLTCLSSKVTSMTMLTVMVTYLSTRCLKHTKVVCKPPETQSHLNRPTIMEAVRRPSKLWPR